MVDFGSRITAAALAAAALAGQDRWTQLFPAVSPAPRALGVFAYDLGRDRAVLFGGWSNFVVLGDTWEWDGAAWRTIAVTNPPLARQAPAFAYDLFRGCIVMFGGGGGGALLDDTWEYDGQQWRQFRPSTPVPRPSPRVNAMMSQTPGGRMLLFGGFTGTPVIALDDTWEWDGTGWTRLSPTTSPPGRAGGGLVTDLG